MNNLQPQQLKHLTRLLEERQQALENEIRSERQAQDDFLDVASDVPDPGDSSFASLSIDLGNASVQRDANEWQAIQKARARIKDGSYGECVECGLPIPYERLEAQPIAERCAPCQDAYEKTHADAGKGATL